jgi:hypothetical protein
MFPKEPTIGQAISISIECGDCGLVRWRKPNEFYTFGFKYGTTFTELGQKLYCAACRLEGEAGKNLVISAAFRTELDRERANASRLNIQAIPGEGLRAICS